MVHLLMILYDNFAIMQRPVGESASWLTKGAGWQTYDRQLDQDSYR